MPEFPLATVVLPLVPSSLVGLVMAEVPTGLAVLQEKFILQLFCPKEIVQEEAAGVRPPEGQAGALQD